MELQHRPDLPTNLLALAVLSLLKEKPRHPYEISFLMKERHLAEAIKLNFGSLYHTIEGLVASGWIAPLQTSREGRRPERTVYELTEPGRMRLLGWLRDLIRTPVKDYMRFEAGLSFITDLSAEEAVRLLRERAQKLAAELETYGVLIDQVLARGLPRVVVVEIDHAQALRKAELEWIKRTADEIDDGRLAWPHGRRQQEEVKK